MALSMKAGKCPTDELSTTNFVIASPQDLDDKKCRSLHFVFCYFKDLPSFNVDDYLDVKYMHDNVQ